MDSEIFKRNAFDRYVQGKVIFGGGAPRFVANRHFNSSSMLGLYTPGERPRMYSSWGT